ncbi:MAG: zinc metallopeptidase [Bacillota bacterium]
MFFPFFWDPTMIILIPAIILSLYAQMKVQWTFAKYNQVSASSRLTGADVANQLLKRAGIEDVRVEMIERNMGDHYDPKNKTLRLSTQVYRGNSLAALGVAAHETGHALQHDHGYLPMQLRASFVPLAQWGSNLAFPLLIIGLLFGMPSLAVFGVYAFTAVVIFQLITLPVEYNASSRAVTLLEGEGMINQQEVGPTRKVLNAAALTYVAAALTGILTLLRLLILSGMLGGRDE